MGFWENGIYFWGTGEQMPPFEGNKGIIGNREHNNVFSSSIFKNMGTS